jgi:Iron-containing redox enzyme
VSATTARQRGRRRADIAAGASGHSALLRRKLELMGGETAAASHALWSHPALRALFPDYLFRIHSIIRASVPLMEAGRARAEQLASSDVVAAGVAGYLAHHIREERHHDDWLLADLGVLGVTSEAVSSRMPSPTVAALVGAQYYWIQHYHPVALLGYIAVLEGTPPVAEHVEGVIARTGIPRDAFRTILRHADLDPHHRDGLDRALDALALSEEQVATVAISAFTTNRLLGQSLRELLESWERRAPDSSG